MIMRKTHSILQLFCFILAQKSQIHSLFIIYYLLALGYCCDTMMLQAMGGMEIESAKYI